MRFSALRSLWQDPSKLNTEGLEEPIEARFRTILLTIAALVIPPVVFLVYWQMMFTSLISPDAMEMAQLSRNLSQGHGFNTYVIRPLAVHVKSGETFNPLRQPDQVHAPLYPFIQGLAFLTFGRFDKEIVCSFVSGAFFLLLIPLVYYLGKRAFNPQVGLAVAGLITVNAMFLDYAISGMHYTLFIFLATWLMLAMFNLSEAGKNAEGQPTEAPKGKLAIVGILAALLYLTDYLFIWFVPFVIWFVMAQGGKRKIKYAAYCLLPFILMTLPWMARNAAVSGNPIFGLRGMELWMSTKGHYPNSVAYRYFPEDLVHGRELFKAIVQKILFSLGKVIANFPQINASWLLAFLLPSLLFRFTDSGVNSLRKAMMGCFLGLLAGMLILQVNMIVLVSVVPTMLLFAVAFLIHLVGQAQLRRSGSILTASLVGMAVVYPLLSTTILEDRRGDIKEIVSAKELKSPAHARELVYSDQPWLTAWYGERPSLWMPYSEGRIGSSLKDLGSHWMFITSAVNDPSNYNSEYWGPVYHQLQTWHTKRLQDRLQAKQGDPVPARPPWPLAPRETKVPLWDTLSEFQTVDQKFLFSKTGPVVPVAYIAELPKPDTRVGMMPTSNRQ